VHPSFSFTHSPSLFVSSPRFLSSVDFRMHPKPITAANKGMRSISRTIKKQVIDVFMKMSQEESKELKRS
jgi:hypothetical protein